jgi:hypothetical protein
MDDDASTRQALRWSNADYLLNNNTNVLPKVAITVGPNKGKLQERPDKGRLPGKMPEPTYSSDPNHRRKLLTGELLAIAMATVKSGKKETMTKMDVRRIRKNFGYMVKTLSKRDESEYESAGRAVIEHHFDNHEHCGAWCRRKWMTKQQREASERFYRCKVKDAKLYSILNEIVSKYITTARLKEIAHGMDTNMNESLNNMISYFAPKNRVYCKSRSLHNRVAFAVGIVSLGFKPFFVRLFKALGIAATPNMLHYLEVKERNRNLRLSKRRTKTYKKDRKQNAWASLKEEEKKAINQRARREGKYRSGGNMQEGGFDGDDDNKGKKKSRKDLVCPFCGLKGHTTKRSKNCLLNEKNPNYVGDKKMPAVTTSDPATEEEEERMAADDIDDMDAMPLDNDNAPEHFVFEEDEFHDTGTWSEDDDGNIHEYGVL